MAAGLTLDCPLPQSAFSYFGIFLASHLTGPGLLRRGLTIQIPRVSHHQLEVFVVVDAGRDVLVVLEPLVLCDTAIT